MFVTQLRANAIDLLAKPLRTETALKRYYILWMCSAFRTTGLVIKVLKLCMAFQCTFVLSSFNPMMRVPDIFCFPLYLMAGFEGWALILGFECSSFRSVEYLMFLEPRERHTIYG